MTGAPVRLRRYVSGAEAALGALDEITALFTGINTRIAHTRRMRVPLPPVANRFEVIDGGGE